MSFRSRAISPNQPQSSFRERAKKIQPEFSELEKIGASGAAELFGGAIGGIPGLAKSTEQLQPLFENLEREARPEYLSSTGLEPSSEKGLTNLFSLIAKIPGIEKFTPEQLR